MLSPREVVFYFYFILGGLNLAGGADFRPLGLVGVLNAAQRHEVTPLFQLNKMSFRINSNYVFLVSYASLFLLQASIYCLQHIYQTFVPWLPCLVVWINVQNLLASKGFFGVLFM